ncbi:MAG TPA: hypothetical protein VIS29_21550, partial [Streptomyces sp.]
MPFWYCPLFCLVCCLVEPVEPAGAHSRRGGAAGCHRVPRAVYFSNCGTSFAVTIAGPVSTGW